MMSRNISIELPFANNHSDSEYVIKTGISKIQIIQGTANYGQFEIEVDTDTIETDNILFQKSKETMGKGIKIKLENAVFVGIVTQVGISKSSSGFKGDLIIKGYSPGFIMDDRPNTQSFTNLQLRDIVSKVKKAYPENIIHFDDSKIAPKHKTKLEYITQYNESGFQFLNRLASDFGEWFYYDGTQTYFGLPAEDHTVKLYTGSDLQSFDISMQVQHVNFKMQLYDYLKNETVNKPGNDAAKPVMDSLSNYAYNASKNLSGFSPQYINAEVYNLETPLSQVANEMINIDTGKDASQFVVLNGTSTCSDLKLGTIVQIREKNKGNEENLGDYRIIAITHTSHGQGNYQNTFRAIPKALKYPPVPPATRPVCPTQPAVVTDNNDSMGRVRVQFYWQKESNQKTPWIRVLSSHAGDGRGFNFMPEVGDEVLVCFVDNDPDQPYVAGSLYHGKAKPGKVLDKNESKSITTAGGNCIVFTDTADNQKIEIYNGKNKITLSCSTDGGMILFSEEDIRLRSNKNIHITAKKSIVFMASDYIIGANKSSDIDFDKPMTHGPETSIRMKVGEVSVQQDTADTIINLKAGEINANANSTLNLKSENDVKIAAKNMLDMDGGQMASLSAEQTIGMDGGQLMTLSGTLVTIN